MDGKEGIINRIISDAEKKATGIVDNANNLVNQKKGDAENWAEKYSNAQNQLIKKEVEETIERRCIVADLDVRKLILEKKQQVLDEVFSKAYDKLCKISKDKYFDIIFKFYFII